MNEWTKQCMRPLRRHAAVAAIAAAPALAHASLHAQETTYAANATHDTAMPLPTS